MRTRTRPQTRITRAMPRVASIQPMRWARSSRLRPLEAPNNTSTEQPTTFTATPTRGSCHLTARTASTIAWWGGPSQAVSLLLAALMAWVGTGSARADSSTATTLTQAEIVNQANAPISSLFQIRLQDSYAPAFQGQLRGQGNSFSIAVGMPLPQYRLLPFPQLSLLTIPAAVTLP